MSKCVRCGRKGLFLKIDFLGRCAECIEKDQEEERKMAQLAKENEDKKRKEVDSLFQKISRGLTDLASEDVLIDQLGCTAQLMNANKNIVKAQVTKGEGIISDLEEFKRSPYALDIIMKHSKPDKSLITLGYRYVVKWDVRISYSNTQKESYDVEEIVEMFKSKVQSKIDSYKELLCRIDKYIVFEKNLSMIPFYKEDYLNGLDSTNIQAPINIERLKMSQVTAKDIFENLGSFVSVSISDNTVGAIKYLHWMPVNRAEYELDNNSMILLSNQVGTNNIICHDFVDLITSLARVGAPFLSGTRKYYDVTALLRKMMESRQWLKEHGYVNVYNVSFETLCDYYEICAGKSSSQALSDSFASAELFRILCKYKAS